MQQKIVLIGGPGSGKTSALNELIKRNYFCMPEISREVTLMAQKKGITQLFLTQPLLFSELLLKGREQQFLEAEQSKHQLVFFDRGIADVHAYMDYYKTNYPATFFEKSNHYRYTKIFHFSPWKEIHTTDNERYETYEQSLEIDFFLLKSYTNLGYKIINVPFGSVTERTNFIINSITYNL